MMRALIGVICVLVIFAGYVRFAPVDVARWHINPGAADFRLPRGWAGFCPGAGSRYSGGQRLAELDEVAMATPRTRRIAGSVEEGQITWETRSGLFGFPDYTTVALRDVGGVMQECIVARQRFGLRDFGANERRLRSWLKQAYGLLEEPDLVWAP